jgi:hypothetical protein
MCIFTSSASIKSSANLALLRTQEQGEGHENTSQANLALLGKQGGAEGGGGMRMEVSWLEGNHVKGQGRLSLPVHVCRDSGKKDRQFS